MALIIVAEDEFLIADVLAIMLEDAGYQVATAPHGLAAMKLIKENRPDLVITDFMMPLMTGLELARELRGDDTLRNVPIVLVSGAQASIGRANPDLFDAVLDKPYGEKQLIEVVDRLLSR